MLEIDPPKIVRLPAIWLTALGSVGMPNVVGEPQPETPAHGLAVVTVRS